MKFEQHLGCFVEAEMFQLLLESLTNPKLILNTYLSQRDGAIQQLLAQIYSPSQSTTPVNQKPFHPVKNNTVSIVFLENYSSCTFQEFVHPVLLKENTRAAPVMYSSATLTSTAEAGEEDNVTSSLSQTHITTTQNLDSAHQQSRDGIGPVHVALLVGNILLDWNWSCLVVPRVVCQGMMGRIITSCSYPLGVLDERPMHKVLEHVASRVCFYNAQKSYDMVKCNSMHFVWELLNGLEMTSVLREPRHGALYRLFVEIHKRGEVCPQYIAPMQRDEFLSSFKSLQTNHRYYFANFKKLDEFVHRLLRENARLSMLFANESQFLRSLAATFWVRHFEDKNIFFDCSIIAGRELLSSYGKG